MEFCRLPRELKGATENHTEYTMVERWSLSGTRSYAAVPSSIVIGAWHGCVEAHAKLNGAKRKKAYFGYLALPSRQLLDIFERWRLEMFLFEKVVLKPNAKLLMSPGQLYAQAEARCKKPLSNA